MSPQPATLGRVPFAPLMESIPETFTAPIREVREHVTGLLLPLASKCREIAARTDLSDEGKSGLVRDAARAVLLDANRYFDRAATQAKRVGDDANGVLNDRLYAGVKPEEVTQAQATIREYTRGDLAVPELAPGPDGTVLLGSGGPLHRLLAATLENVPTPQAATLVLALQRLDPLARTLIGGDAVVEVARRTLELRRAGTDEEVAGLIEIRDIARTAAAVVKGDISTATAFVSKTAGIPKDAIPALLAPRKTDADDARRRKAS